MASTEIDFQPARPRQEGLAAKWHGFKTFCYNPDNGTFCGRTGPSWFKITVFYLIYYGCLAAFSVAMMAIFFTTLDNNEPKQQGMQSLIKGNPGLAFRPMPNTESTLIKFKSGEEKSYKTYVDAINKYLEPYDETKVEEEGGETISCKGLTKRAEGEKRPCKFDMDDLGSWCTAGNSFGYFEGQPCVILKMNRVFGWLPEVYVDNSEAPAELVTLAAGALNIDNSIPITCQGARAKDRPYFEGFDIWPPTGFEPEFFPYLNQASYRSQLVAARINITKNVEVDVWCRAWAKNLKNDHKNDQAGSVRFKLYIRQV